MGNHAQDFFKPVRLKYLSDNMLEHVAAKDTVASKMKKAEKKDICGRIRKRTKLELRPKSGILSIFYQQINL